MPESLASLASRVADLFKRKRVNAATTYVKLLKRGEVDGKELSDEEAAELFEAMEAARITEAQFKVHRGIIQKRKQSEAADAANSAARAKLTAAEALLKAVQDKLARLMQSELKEAEERVAQLRSEILSTGTWAGDLNRNLQDEANIYADPTADPYRM